MGRPIKEGKRFSCNLDSELYDTLHNFAEENGMTLTGVVEKALRLFIKDNGEDNQPPRRPRK